MKILNLLAAAIVVLNAPSLKADEQKISKILSPMVVTVDRRPEKDVKYSRCIGLFETEKEWQILAGAKTIGDRKCPSPSDLKANLEVGNSSEKITTDDGETISETANGPKMDVKKPADYKGKQYKFSGFPNILTISKNQKPTSDTMKKLDSFCVAQAEEVGNHKNSMTLACDDCSTLRACLDSLLSAQKPLAIGDVKTTVHNIPTQFQDLHI